MGIGKRLRQARKASGLSMTAAANKLGISQPYLSQLENEIRSNPSLDLLKAISELYNVSLESIASHINDFEPEIISNNDTDKEGKIGMIVELLQKVENEKFDTAFNIVQNILQEFLD